jgi:hypothetical protein
MPFALNVFIKNIFDELVKGQKLGEKVKSSRCKARESLGMRRTLEVRRMIYPVKYRYVAFEPSR